MHIIHGNDPHNSEQVSVSRDIRINSCGVDLNTDHPQPRTGLAIRRPQGRKDYQIIYVWSGHATYTADGAERLLGPGSLICYKPGEPQFYTYHADMPVECCWIHFTGSQAEGLLRRSGLWERQAYHVGLLAEINQIIEKILREIQRRPLQYEDLCAAYFVQMLTLIARRLQQRDDAPAYERAQRIMDVMEHMHRHYNEPLTLEAYAAQCAWSRHHFLHAFKAYTGQSPHAYLTAIRMDQARLLLRGSALTVQDIACLTGYGDPLYFSRLFARKFGQSPSAYQRACQGEGE